MSNLGTREDDREGVVRAVGGCWLLEGQIQASTSWTGARRSNIAPQISSNTWLNACDSKRRLKYSGKVAIIDAHWYCVDCIEKWRNPARWWMSLCGGSFLTFPANQVSLLAVTLRARSPRSQNRSKAVLVRYEKWREAGRRPYTPAKTGRVR